MLAGYITGPTEGEEKLGCSSCAPVPAAAKGAGIGSELKGQTIPHVPSSPSSPSSPLHSNNQLVNLTCHPQLAERVWRHGSCCGMLCLGAFI